MMATQVPRVPLFFGLRKLRCLVWSSRCISSKLRTMSHSLDGSTKEMANDEIQLTEKKPSAQRMYDTLASKITMEKEFVADFDQWSLACFDEGACVIEGATKGSLCRTKYPFVIAAATSSNCRTLRQFFEKISLVYIGASETLNTETEKQDLKATLELLLGLGCTEDQIRENAIVLNFTPQEIEKRVKVLRSVVQKKITVELLLHATERHRENYFAKINVFDKDILNGFSSKTEYLANRLRCTLDDVRKMYSNHVLLAIVSAQGLVRKLDFLMEAGYTDKEILKTPECLTVSLMKLSKRLDLFGKMNLQKLPDLKIIGASERMFHRYMSRPRDYMEIFQEYKDFYGLVSKLLAIPPSLTEQMVKEVQCMDLVDLKDKIKYLLNAGVKPYDILENSYLLRYSMDRIRNAVKETKGMLGRELSLVNIATLIVKGKRGSSRAFPRNFSTFFTLLELNPKQNKTFKCAEVRLVTKRTKKLLQENYTFLQDKGFIVTDLQSCPLILGHDTETLKEGYEVFLHTLEDNLSLKKHCEDSIKRINVLQYLIEKELNFPGVVSLYDEDPKWGEEEEEEIEDGSKSEHFGVDDE